MCDPAGSSDSARRPLTITGWKHARKNPRLMRETHLLERPLVFTSDFLLFLLLGKNTPKKLRSAQEKKHVNQITYAESSKNNKRTGVKSFLMLNVFLISSGVLPVHSKFWCC
jgi:hypothetical protein